jgi:hypothetical protein
MPRRIKRVNPGPTLDVQIRRSRKALDVAKKTVRERNEDALHSLLEQRAERDYGVKCGIVVMDTITHKRLKVTDLRFIEDSLKPMVTGVYMRKDGTRVSQEVDILLSWRLLEEKELPLDEYLKLL